MGLTSEVALAELKGPTKAARNKIGANNFLFILFIAGSPLGIIKLIAIVFDFRTIETLTHVLKIN